MARCPVTDLARIRSRSISATPARTVRIILPAGVPRSTCSRRITRVTPSCSSSSVTWMAWEALRAIRSRLATTTAWTSPERQAARSACHCGRSFLAPLRPSSTNLPASCQPRALMAPSHCSRWVVRLDPWSTWPAELTRPYHAAFIAFSYSFTPVPRGWLVVVG
ncbi:hypothetical protein ARTHRO9AX_210075 [Arthrobacter sp. 9AX]|nr:hypothetical protein ARTHRO9AX_210075 [Arthrobacter sp. 9AX]